MRKTLPRLLRILTAAAVLALSALFLLGKISRFPQAGTTFLEFAATGSIIALCVMLGFAALAFFVGRFYCACLCPLGILQDLILSILQARNRSAGRYYDNASLRYNILALTLGFAVAGWALLAEFLEPFSFFGKIANGLFFPLAEKAADMAGIALPSMNLRPETSGIAIGAAFLAALTALAAWKKRVYCTSVCPVGTFLGLLSRYGFFGLKIKESDCVNCRRCSKVCPASCIDLKEASPRIDNELCLRCMDCIADCPKNAIVWLRNGREKKPHATVSHLASAPQDLTRRDFITGAAGTFFVSSAFAYILKPGGAASRQAVAAIYPPGAGNAERFAGRCTSCLLCAGVCRGKVIRPPNASIPLVHLDYEKGMCEFNCVECLKRCPTGALQRMPLADKKRLRIGMAIFHPSRCVCVVDGTSCGACAEHCPTGAVRMVLEKNRPCPIPKIDEKFCIGCGNCSFPCPVRPLRAITVEPIPAQTVAADPHELSSPIKFQPAAANADDWLL